MKTHPKSVSLFRALRLLSLFVAIPVVCLLRAADDKIIAAVRAADDERLSASIAGDRAKLEQIYSDDLHYVHSSGKHDTKASQIQGVTTGGSKYEKFDHQERTFEAVAPGIVLMRGRVHVHMSNRKTGAKAMNDINYLAVWREEKGKWRFLAWQASKGVEDAAPATKK
jgi:hypothetical protein